MAVISGIVVDPKGKPVEHARVYFVSGPVSLPDIATLSNREGRFSLSAPMLGAYTIECVVEGFAPVRVTVDVTRSQQANVEIRVKR